MATKTRQKGAAPAPFSLISTDKLQQMYTAMLHCRVLDAHIKKAGFKLKGTEAAFAGAAIDLQPEDVVVDSTHGAYSRVLRKSPLQSILTGKRETPKAGVRKATAAADCALATGIAYRHAAEQQKSITVAFLTGDLADLESQAAFRIAALHKLPIIYVYIGKAVLPVEDLLSVGFPVIPVAGSDVVAVYRVAHECATRARRGTGPSILACDFSSIHGDPLRNMEKYLSAKGLPGKEKRSSIIQGFEKEIERAKKARATLADIRNENIFLV
ncbi:MAG TPA: hypothetical protein VHB45_02140 [Alloacidobacterium sp.]|nr:hypothetical protein [Alloacidobacterium sp.]